MRPAVRLSSKVRCAQTWCEMRSGWQLFLLGAVLGSLITVLAAVLLVDGRSDPRPGTGATDARDGEPATIDPAPSVSAATQRARARPPVTSAPAATATPPPAPACRGEDVPTSGAADAIGSLVTVCGSVSEASYQDAVNGGPTFVNFDRLFPNQTFTAVIWGSERGLFSTPPEQLFGAGACVRVTGLVEIFEGVPEIIVTGPGQISLC